MAGARKQVLALFVGVVVVLASRASAAPCTPECGSCKAVSDAATCCGIRDSDCATCADGYKWWPCGDQIDKCVCSGGTSSDVEEAASQETQVADPADAGAAEQQAATNEEQASAGASSGTSAIDDLASTIGAGSAEEDAAEAAEAESATGTAASSSAAGSASTLSLPAVANWAQCGGLSLAKCNLDAPCAPCADPLHECVSEDNAWYWQCKPRPAGSAVPAAAAAAAAEQTTFQALEVVETQASSGAIADTLVTGPATEPVMTAPTSVSGVLGLNNGCPSGCSQGDLSSLLTSSQWEKLFPHRNDPACKSNKLPDGTVGFDGDFYTYEAFIGAAKLYPCFLGQGDKTERTRELTAFLAQISHETTGGWPTAPDGAQAWGLCWKEEVGCETGACAQYCAAGDPCKAAGEGTSCPCTSGKTYHGRGPMQLSWNYNYGPTGMDLSSVPEYANLDLLNDPDQITKDARLAYATAIDFWMKPRGAKPSAHAVMLGCWEPSAQDIAAGRKPGFGATTNIINGGLECGIKDDYRVEDRVAYFERFNAELGVDGGDNLRCDDQQRF